MATPDILIGTGVTSTQEFRADGVLTNPTTVSLRVLAPGGALTTYVFGVGADIVRDSTGIYSFAHVPDAVGRWWYSWLGTGTVPLRMEEFVIVQPSRLG